MVLYWVIYAVNRAYVAYVCPQKDMPPSNFFWMIIGIAAIVATAVCLYFELEALNKVIFILIVILF